MNASVKRCYKQDEFVKRIRGALGVTLQDVSCNIVNTAGMTQVMKRAGWSANETHGVVGFQFGKEVYVLDSTPWTVLHELIHRAGVNSDRLSRFVAEGLTEAIALELKRGDDEHRPTYPKETTWVRTILLPRLNMTAVELGKQIAASSDPPRLLAGLMAQAKPGSMVASLERELQPQQAKQPSFNRGHVTRGSGLGSQAHLESGAADRATGVMAGIFLLTGAALALPRLWREGRTQ